MTRPPLYVRRPFLAGLVRQLPLLAVLVVVASGLLLVTVDHWRVGLHVQGIDFHHRVVFPVKRESGETRFESCDDDAQNSVGQQVAFESARVITTIAD